jgi:hypothetical protein
VAKPGPKTEPPEESRAATIVAAVTACATDWLDRGDGVQRPDYSLLDGGGLQIGVLEVTALSSRSHNSFFSRTASKHRSWSDPNLRCNWLVSVDSAARELRTLRGPLTSSLPALEAEGVRFASSQPANYLGPVAAIPAELSALGIVELAAFGPEGDGDAAVVVNVMPVGGPYGVESATTALDAVLDLPDNRKKLDVDFARRELFVWAPAVGSRGRPQHLLGRPLANISDGSSPTATAPRGDRNVGGVVVGRRGLRGKRPVARRR